MPAIYGRQTTGNGGAVSTDPATPGILSGPVRLRWLIVVIAVMAVLTAGWPLVNLEVSNQHPIAAHTKLTVGTSTRNAASVVMGPGWTLQSSQSNPQLGYLLRRGPVELSISYVPAFGHSPMVHLLAGLRAIFLLSNPGASFSAPVVVTSEQGLKGLKCVVNVDGIVGVATVVPEPSGNFAIMLILLAHRNAVADMMATAQQVMRTLRFPAAAP